MKPPRQEERKRRASGNILGATAFGLFALVCAVSPALLPQERAGDPVRGAMLFEKRCTGCHALEQDKEGPRLGDVYGRKAGSVPGFPYSEALRQAAFSWDDARLDQWLSDTESLIANNDMAFRVPSAEERADILAFLRASARKKAAPAATD